MRPAAQSNPASKPCEEIHIAGLGAAELSPCWLEWVYDGVLEQLPWTRLLEELRLQLNANFVSLAIRSPSTDDPGLVVFAGQAVPGTQLTYERFFYRLDPFVNLPLDQLWMLHERIDEQQWLESALYCDFLSTLDIRHVMGADIAVGDSQLSRLRISRGQCQPPFSEAERQFCTVLLGHLKRALRLHSRLQGVDSERRLYASALQCLSIGTLLLDAHGRVVQCSEVAYQLLTGERGVHLSGARLQAENSVDERRLSKAIARVLAARADEQRSQLEALSVGWPGKSLGVLLRGLISNEPHGSEGVGAIEVTLRDPQQYPELSEQLLRQLFQLTPAEALLAVQLCHGKTLDQVAQELNISRNTARAHLRVIFSKTGTARQGTLVQLLLGSVAALHPLATGAN